MPGARSVVLHQVKPQPRDCQDEANAPQMPGRGGGRSIAATDYLTLRDKLFHAYYAKHSYLVTTCDDHMLTGATASFFSSSFFLYLFLYLLQIFLRLW